MRTQVQLIRLSSTGRAATSLAIEAFSESPLGRLILALTLVGTYD